MARSRYMILKLSFVPVLRTVRRDKTRKTNKAGRKKAVNGVVLALEITFSKVKNLMPMKIYI